MKKKNKVFWIVVACIFLLGVSSLVTGFALGGSLRDIPQRYGWFYTQNKINHSIDFTLEQSLVELPEIPNPPEPNQSDFQQPYSFSNGQILIDVSAMNVRIIESDGDKIEVDTSQLQNNMLDVLTIIQEQDFLSITTEHSSNLIRDFIGTNTSRNTLTITIPSDFTFDHVNLTLGAGTVRIDSLIAEDVILRVGAGDLIINELVADTFDLDVGAGSADISNMSVSTAIIDNGVGNVKLQGELLGFMELSNGIGETTFVANGQETDYNYSITSGIGTIQVGNQRFSGIGNNNFIDNNAYKTINISSGIGQVSVIFQ